MPCPPPEQLSALSLSALEEREAVSLLAHLELCPCCSSDLADLKPVREALLRAPGPRKPPRALRARVVSEAVRQQALFQQAARPHRPHWLPRWRVVATTSLLALLTGILTNLLGNQIYEQSPLPQQGVFAQPDQARAPEAGGYLMAGDRSARLDLHDLPAGSQRYSLWTQEPSGSLHSSSGHFRVDAEGQASVELESPPTPGSRLLVMREPAGARGGPGVPVLTVLIPSE